MFHHLPPHMKRSLLALLLFAGCIGSRGQAPPITGFSDSASRVQHSLEVRFDQALDPAHLGNTIRQLSAFPHHLGSPGSRAVADSILHRFRSYGWLAQLRTYQVLFPTPRIRRLEMLSPSRFIAQLNEPALKEDAASRQTGQLPPYNAWSADGDVTAELVYVNYGLPEDYDWLDRLGIDVKGKIVIARYGKSWRGIKPKLAQQRGAVGCLLYSDPADDGYVAGDIYPTGPYKNEHGVQRGSVMDIPVSPGDPLTPGIASTPQATRISRDSAVNLLGIPVLPISYGDARPLLAALHGPVVPAEWQGALPFTYHVGPGRARVRLQLAFDWKTVPCYNVIAKIPGSQYPDQWIVRGNHHDAWNNGAMDPISGVASLLEEARSIGKLLKTGWRPKRTLVYCAWDGEEPGLIGSTEFVEDMLTELQQKAIVYINTDDNSRGYLVAGGSPALQTLMNEVTCDVTDPQSGGSVRDRLHARRLVSAASVGDKQSAFERRELELNPLGSGSDYTPFLQHAGIATLDLWYTGESGGGEYHSVYDSYDHFVRFKDPGFVYGVTLAKTTGRAVLRLCEAELLPFHFHTLASVVGRYVGEVKQLVGDKRALVQIDTRLRAMNAYAAATDTARNIRPPAVPSPVPYLDFSPLENALDLLTRQTEIGRERYSALLASGDRSRMEQVNRVFASAELALLLPGGLPGRKWYKHAIYAPGLHTGYGAKTLPGIREAIEQGRWDLAQEGITGVATALRRLAEHLGAAMP